MSERLVVAIDGPAASGKSTLARRLASHFGLPHLDTGSLYRAVALRASRDGVAPEVAAGRLSAADLADPALRDDAIGQAASRVAANPEVRAKLLEFQRNFANQAGGAVLDGRDIGTVICPAAPVKFYVTASLEARTDRRVGELRARGGDPIRPRVLAELEERDRRDSGRADAPLRAAPDAYRLDTTDMDAERALAAALAYMAGKGFRRAGS